MGKITHVLAGEECSICKGRGRVRGGQVEYGELVACPVCDGKGYTVKAISLREIADLLATTPRS
jgi:DnaJ-class molecular chaperone